MPVCRRSVTIMSATGTDMNKYSDVIQGDSYYGYTDGLHTIQVIYGQYIGRVRIQATLSLDPGESDWFDIIPEITTGRFWNPQGFLQWNSNEPADKSEAYTFRGNYTFIRCYMDREHVGDGTTYDPSYGQIKHIILSS
jgi:hypothetical protein